MVMTPPARTRKLSKPTGCPWADTTQVLEDSISPPLLVIRYVALPRGVQEAASDISGGRGVFVNVDCGVGVKVFDGVGVKVFVSSSTLYALTQARKL